MAQKATLTKAPRPKLILPKVIYKQSSKGQVKEARTRVEQQSITDGIDHIIEKISCLASKDQQHSPGLVPQLVEMLRQYKRKQGCKMASTHSESDIRLMKLQMKSMQADLEVRQQQINNFQARIDEITNDSRERSGNTRFEHCRSEGRFPLINDYFTNAKATPSPLKKGCSEYGMDSIHKHRALSYKTLKLEQSIIAPKSNKQPALSGFSPRQALKNITNTPTPKGETMDLQQELKDMRIQSNKKDEQIRKLQSQLNEAKAQHEKALPALEAKYKIVKRQCQIYKKQCRELADKAIYRQLLGLKSEYPAE